ncbi:MAG: hypothetical protein GY934_13510 [Gammaproteobacteria bacterium]|nr:hypothetical protein [Gammaproteobacteria bacterium]
MNKGYGDFVDEIEQAQDKEDLLSRISTHAADLKQTEKDIANAEMKLKKLKGKKKDLEETKLPELFHEAGWGLGAKIQTTGGLPLVFKKVTRTSIAGERKPTAIRWLDDNGHGGIVSRRVEISFNRTEQEKVDALLRLIGRSWKNHKTVLDVNAATVKALVTKLLAAGEVDVPLETFGVHQADTVTISSK